MHRGKKEIFKYFGTKFRERKRNRDGEKAAPKLRNDSVCKWPSIGGSGTALFGSSIMHNNVIRLSISKGMMEREGNEDWFLAGTDINDMIVEVEMSYTQFAEAITSLNIGEGIPVTITKVNGTFVEPCPYSDRQKVMRREVDEATRDLVRQLEKRSEEIEKLLDEKRVLSRDGPEKYRLDIEKCTAGVKK